MDTQVELTKAVRRYAVGFDASSLSGADAGTVVKLAGAVERMAATLKGLAASAWPRSVCGETLATARPPTTWLATPRGPRVRASVSTAEARPRRAVEIVLADTLGAMTLGGHVGVRDQQVGADFSGSLTVLPGFEHDCRAVLVG